MREEKQRGEIIQRNHKECKRRALRIRNRQATFQKVIQTSYTEQRNRNTNIRLRQHSSRRIRKATTNANNRHNHEFNQKHHKFLQHENQLANICRELLCEISNISIRESRRTQTKEDKNTNGRRHDISREPANSEMDRQCRGTIEAKTKAVTQPYAAIR